MPSDNLVENLPPLNNINIHQIVNDLLANWFSKLHYNPILAQIFTLIYQNSTLKFQNRIAEELDVSQSTISRNLKLLEGELDLVKKIQSSSSDTKKYIINSKSLVKLFCIPLFKLESELYLLRQKFEKLKQQFQTKEFNINPEREDLSLIKLINNITFAITSAENILSPVFEAINKEIMQIDFDEDAGIFNINTTYKILMIEENPRDFNLIEEYLSNNKGSEFTLSSSKTLQLGLKRLSQEIFDLILLDLSLPDSHGIETFVTVHKEAKNIPIVILTGYPDDSLSINAVKLGAQDYLIKDELNPVMLYRSIIFAIERANIKHKD